MIEKNNLRVHPENDSETPLPIQIPLGKFRNLALFGAEVNRYLAPSVGIRRLLKVY